MSFRFCHLSIFFQKKKSKLRLATRVQDRSKTKTGRKKRIWVHALSLGEVISALPFVKALKAKNKELDIVFTASTKTGFDMARQLFLKEKERLVDQLGYFPFDLGHCVKKSKPENNA